MTASPTDCPAGRSSRRISERSRPLCRRVVVLHERLQRGRVIAGEVLTALLNCRQREIVALRQPSDLRAGGVWGAEGIEDGSNFSLSGL
jgi:hypothetical protein